MRLWLRSLISLTYGDRGGRTELRTESALISAKSHPLPTLIQPSLFSRLWCQTGILKPLTMSAEEPRKRKLSEDGNQAGSTTAKRERVRCVYQQQQISHSLMFYLFCDVL